MLMDGEGTAATQTAVNNGVTDLGGWDVQGAKLLFELIRVVDHRREVAEGNKLAVVQQATHEAGIAVPPLLAIGQHVGAGAELGIDAEAHCVIRRGLKVRVIQLAFHPVVDCLEHPARAGPTADTHYGKWVESWERERATATCRVW